MDSDGDEPGAKKPEKKEPEKKEAPKRIKIEPLPAIPTKKPTEEKKVADPKKDPPKIQNRFAALRELDSDGDEPGAKKPEKPKEPEKKDPPKRIKIEPLPPLPLPKKKEEETKAPPKQSNRFAALRELDSDGDEPGAKKTPKLEPAKSDNMSVVANDAKSNLDDKQSSKSTAGKNLLFKKKKKSPSKAKEGDDTSNNSVPKSPMLKKKPIIKGKKDAATKPVAPKGSPVWVLFEKFIGLMVLFFEKMRELDLQGLRKKVTGGAMFILQNIAMVAMMAFGMLMSLGSSFSASKSPVKVGKMIRKSHSTPVTSNKKDQVA